MWHVYTTQTQTINKQMQQKFKTAAATKTVMCVFQEPSTPEQQQHNSARGRQLIPLVLAFRPLMTFKSFAMTRKVSMKNFIQTNIEVLDKFTEDKPGDESSQAFGG